MKVQIDRYSCINGAAIEYLDTTDYFKGWKTVFAKEGDKVCFRELNFGKKAPKTVTFYAKAPQGAKVAVTAGETAEFEIPAAADWTEVTLPMPVKVKGMQDLKVEALTAAPLEIDWVQFK
jgi:hypothetical protein